MLGRAHAAIELADEARGMLHDASDLSERVSVDCGHTYWLAVAGRFPQALAGFDRIISLSGGDPQMGRELVGYSPLIWAEFMAAWMLAQAGRFGECWPRAEGAIRLARSVDTSHQVISGQIEGDRCATLRFASSSTPRRAQSLR